MALAGNEAWQGGFVVDRTTGQMVVVNDAAGASWWGGFLRDADGRLVVTWR